MLTVDSKTILQLETHTGVINRRLRLLRICFIYNGSAYKVSRHAQVQAAHRLWPERNRTYVSIWLTPATVSCQKWPLWKKVYYKRRRNISPAMISHCYSNVLQPSRLLLPIKSSLNLHLAFFFLSLFFSLAHQCLMIELWHFLLVVSNKVTGVTCCIPYVATADKAIFFNMVPMKRNWTHTV